MSLIPQLETIETKPSYSMLQDYFWREMKRVYGKDYDIIYKLLGDVPNGHCGVETLYYIFPALLRARGVTPTMSYIDVEGLPKEDGDQAATPEEREVIKKALREAGFPID